MRNTKAGIVPQSAIFVITSFYAGSFLTALLVAMSPVARLLLFCTVIAVSQQQYELLYNAINDIITKSFDIHSRQSIAQNSNNLPRSKVLQSGATADEIKWREQLLRQSIALNGLVSEIVTLLEAWKEQQSSYAAALEIYKEIRSQWHLMVEAIYSNCSHGISYAEDFRGLALSPPNNLTFVIRKLRMAIEEDGNRYFDAFLVNDDSEFQYDTDQSRMYMYERFMLHYQAIQGHAYNMLLVAYNQTVGDKWLRIETETRSAFSHTLLKQQEQFQRLAPTCDRHYRPNPKLKRKPIMANRISVQTANCSSHFYTIAPLGIRSRYGVYDNVQITCYISHDQGLASQVLQQDSIFERTCASDFVGGVRYRWINTDPVLVKDEDTQFICRLTLFEDFCPRYPILRIRADVCDRFNSTDSLAFLYTANSSSTAATMASVIWPYVIEQNHQVPKLTGHVVGIQLSSVNYQLVVRIRTNYRHVYETSVPMKPISCNP